MVVVDVNMKVSVIIPLYNKALFVTKALDSVLAQTFTDYECVIINDGSTDDSASIAQQWMQNKACGERFRLINQPNAGVSAARNHGIELSQGEYIAFLDADDWWEPNYLEEMTRLAGEYSEAGILASNYIYYKPGKTRKGVDEVYDISGERHSEIGWSGYINYPRSYYENTGQVVWTGATMINRLVLHDVCSEKGEYFQRGICLGEDFLLWAKVALNHKVAFLNQPLAYYNNDVPASLRLTRNLHAPQTNMLWYLDEIESCLKSVGVGVDVVVPSSDWKHLFDHLRINGLLDYWMSNTYHHQAEVELKKVSCPLPKAYSMPLWWLRAKKHIRTIGSYCKQRLLFK